MIWFGAGAWPDIMSAMIQPPLHDRIVLVTGASSGIGEAVARAAAAGGARLVLNARRGERLDALARELTEDSSGDRAVCVAGDAADDDVIRAMFDTPLAKFGKEPDAVIVNAGRGLKGSVLDSDITQWESMVRTNLIGAAKLMREAARRMIARLDASQSGGESWVNTPRDIVCLGSVVGRHISPFSSMYGSTKFGVHSLGEALRREVGPKGIRVSVIEPAIVRSEFQEVAGYDAAGFGAFMEKIGPVLEPSDVGQLIASILTLPARVNIADVVIRPTRQDYP